MQKEQDADISNTKLYELGYLLVPTIAEEQLPAEIEALKAVLAKAGAEIVAEDSPKPITLAYSMIHGASGQKKKFDKAYFGWVKFNVQAAGAEFINAHCKNNEHFLRFMIVKTVKDEPSYTPRNPKIVVTESPALGQRLTPETSSAPKKAVDEAELDKTLERLTV